MSTLRSANNSWRNANLAKRYEYYERAQQPLPVQLTKQAKVRARRAKILQAIREKHA